jgi:hypothetical protein
MRRFSSTEGANGGEGEEKEAEDDSRKNMSGKGCKGR